jgi:hypothetical protein
MYFEEKYIKTNLIKVIMAFNPLFKDIFLCRPMSSCRQAIA